MSNLASLTCSWLLAAALLGPQVAMAATAPAAVVAPAPKAAIQRLGTASCRDTNHLVSHVAHLSIDPRQTQPCGHLLSTDTVLAVHHWDKT